MKLAAFLSISILSFSTTLIAQDNLPNKITVIKHTTDAAGNKNETREVKTGQDAAHFYATHPELRAASGTEMHTTRVTITKRTIDPVTGKQKTERIVKEGKEAENFDWREAGYNPVPKSGMAEIAIAPKPAEAPKKIAVDNADSEDISIEIDNTTDAENRAYLGVSSSEMPSNKGVVIDFVLKNSPAALAGLTEWDIITAVNGTNVRNSIELQKVLEPFEPSDKIKIDYLRNNEPKSVDVTLADSHSLEAEKKAETPPVKPTEKPKKMASKFGAPLVGTMQNVPLTDFRIYPNPSGSGMFTVQFTTTKSDFILLKVIDTNGRSEIFTREINGIAADYTYQVDVQHRTPGDYTLIVTHNTTEYREVLHFNP